MTTVIPMSVEPTAVDGLLAITMKQVTDDRGTVREFYRQSAWREAGLPDLGPWQQVNLTETRPGALRGLHGEAADKLIDTSVRAQLVAIKQKMLAARPRPAAV